MTLVTQFFADQRDQLLMRLGCWLVCFSLVVGLMLPQQRAYAVDPLTMTAVASVAAAYLGACGLSVVVSGMDKDALVSSVQRLIQEFLDTQLGGMTIQDWLGSVWDLAVIAGKIFMGRPLTNEFVGFAQWVAQKYGAQVGNNMIYSGVVVDYADGSIVLTQVSESYKSLVKPNTRIPAGEFVLGTPMTLGDSESNCPIYQFSSGYTLRSYRAYSSSGVLTYYIGSTKGNDSVVWGTSTNRVSPYYLVASSQYLIPCYLHSDGSLVIVAGNWAILLSYVDGYTGETSTLGIDRSESMSYIPNGIAADQGIALDVGVAATMDLDLVLQGVLDNVLAGTLETTMEVAGEVTEPIDPPAGEITDVDNLGLSALGAALTSRFPFSIPWDFFRAVQLLAAPAKAPHFEVDFLKPIEHRVGKWQGSTTVILDFSQYAIIGQVSRWASTIGFCLMLAGATKRLIWTA